MLAAFRRSPVLTAHLLLFAVVVIWGTTFTLVKGALANVSPLLFNLLRMAFAFAFLLAFNWRKVRSARRLDLGAGCTAGVFLALGYQFQTAGLARTTPAKSAFITGLVVVLVPLIGLVPGVRTPTMSPARWNALCGAALAFAGLVLLTTPPQSKSMLEGIGVGEVLTLACALAFAGHLYSVARVTTNTDAGLLGTIQIGTAVVVMLLTLPLEDQLSFHWNAEVAWALLITSLFATALAFTIQTWAQKHISPTHAALIFTLEPVFAWVTSMFFFGERLNARSTKGAGLILIGILLSELWPHRKTESRVIPIEPTSVS